MNEKAYFSYGEETENLYYQHIRRSEPFGRSSHYHANNEIYYLLAGRRTYFIKERTYVIEPGDLIFINKYDVHKTSDVSEPGHERIVINFSDSFLNGGTDAVQVPVLLLSFDQSVDIIRLKLQDQVIVQAIMSKLHHELKEQGTGFEIMGRQFIAELLLFAVRYTERHTEAAMDHASPLHHKVSEIVQFINQHYNKPLTLEKLSQQFYLSSYYLCRVFKEVTGFTFIEYVNLTRIREAERLLKESKLKVIEIANLVGFENSTHFGRVFRKATGVAPLHYRKLG